MKRYKSITVALLLCALAPVLYACSGEKTIGMYSIPEPPRAHEIARNINSATYVIDVPDDQDFDRIVATLPIEEKIQDMEYCYESGTPAGGAVIYAWSAPAPKNNPDKDTLTFIVGFTSDDDGGLKIEYTRKTMPHACKKIGEATEETLEQERKAQQQQAEDLAQQQNEQTPQAE